MSKKHSENEPRRQWEFREFCNRVTVEGYSGGGGVGVEHEGSCVGLRESVQEGCQ